MKLLNKIFFIRVALILTPIPTIDLYLLVKSSGEEGNTYLALAAVLLIFIVSVVIGLIIGWKMDAADKKRRSETPVNAPRLSIEESKPLK